ncbi:MAG TPA: VWA domain-containing protein [Pyrinomonadaceae bacterium]|nr:VWA domain-containing protein [Pyrinomonadaceae bacterium]
MKKLLVLILSATLFASATAQSARQSQKAPPPQKPATVQLKEPTPEPTPPDQGDIVERIDTDLVTVPVIVSSRDGKYIADLTKEEFTLKEDGVPQQINFLATVNAPFHVVLLLDTSASTREKLGMIQRAAMTFVEQLNNADKVKVISFDDRVRDLNDFTSDKALLRSVISNTAPGEGTKVYDAFELGLNTLRHINGRRAIVIFTDGVDWHSDRATFDGTLKNLDETGVIVYPIRFDTRADTERLLREQEAQTNGVGLPTSDVIRGTGGRPTTTAPTFPGGDPNSVPSGGQRRGTSLPDIIFSRPNIRRPPSDPQGSPTDPFPNPNPTGAPPPIDRTGGTRTDTPNDSIKAMLDQAYLTADSYLRDLADRSGGQLQRADTLAMLPQAFAAIAAELRTQYLLGYYPTNRAKDGKYRKIQVKSTRKDVAVRARPGYSAAPIANSR